MWVCLLLVVVCVCVWWWWGVHLMEKGVLGNLKGVSSNMAT
jgi:hypothetical protein